MGKVQLIAAHYVNRRFTGQDLDHLTHDCAVVLAETSIPTQLRSTTTNGSQPRTRQTARPCTRSFMMSIKAGSTPANAVRQPMTSRAGTTRSPWRSRPTGDDRTSTILFPGSWRACPTATFRARAESASSRRADIVHNPQDGFYYALVYVNLREHLHWQLPGPERRTLRIRGPGERGAAVRSSRRRSSIPTGRTMLLRSIDVRQCRGRSPATCSRTASPTARWRDNGYWSARRSAGRTSPSGGPDQLDGAKALLPGAGHLELQVRRSGSNRLPVGHRSQEHGPQLPDCWRHSVLVLHAIPLLGLSADARPRSCTGTHPDHGALVLGDLAPEEAHPTYIYGDESGGSRLAARSGSFSFRVSPGGA